MCWVQRATESRCSAPPGRGTEREGYGPQLAGPWVSLYTVRKSESRETPTGGGHGLAERRTRRPLVARLTASGALNPFRA